MKRIPASVALAISLGAFLIGITCGIMVRSWDPLSLIAPTIGRDLFAESNGFDQFVTKWNIYVVAHDGFIPADPYRGLIDTGVFATYAELRGIVFGRCLPPRINPELSKNPHRVILWQDRPDLDEMWFVYADGLWARVPYWRASQEDDDWCSQKVIAGYPTWSTLKEEDAWVAHNKNSLLWNEKARMYLVAGNSQK